MLVEAIAGLFTEGSTHVGPFVEDPAPFRKYFTMLYEVNKERKGYYITLITSFSPSKEALLVDCGCCGRLLNALLMIWLICFSIS